MKVCKETHEDVKNYLSECPSSKPIEIECFRCGKPSIKRRKEINVAIKKGSSMFCSSTCAYEERKTGKFYKCFCCDTVVWRSDSNIARTIFCSRSCASKIINQIRNLPEKEQNKLILTGNLTPINKKCLCGKDKSYGEHTLCLNCKKIVTKEKVYSTTLKELKERDKTYKSTIRFYARMYFKIESKDLKECKICKYSTYVELCHIKPVGDFGEESTLGEINSLENLVYLCPNHHKELDLKLIRLEN